MIQVFLSISIAINIFFIIKYIKMKNFYKNSEKLFIEENLNHAIKSAGELTPKDGFLLAKEITDKFITLLRRHYNISYFTILRKNNGVLTILNSDVEEEMSDEVYKHCVELMDMSEGKPIIDTYCDYESAKTRKIKSSYFIAIKDIGALYIENCKKSVFEEEMFGTVVKAIGIVLEKSIEQEKLSSLAMKDNLTGLYNRNYMWENIEVLKKESNNLLLAIMDIDYFKEVNDTYGHDFGDVVLKTLSSYVKDRLDRNDEIYRYGGEEFVIIFKDQDISQVENKLNNIRTGISRLDITSGSIKIRRTASFGVTNIDNQAPINESIRKADYALYKSKESGRNKVTVVI